MMNKIHNLLWKMNLVEFPVSYKTLYKSTLEELHSLTETAVYLEKENNALEAIIKAHDSPKQSAKVVTTVDVISKSNKNKKPNKSKNKSNIVNTNK